MCGWPALIDVMKPDIVDGGPSGEFIMHLPSQKALDYHPITSMLRIRDGVNKNVTLNPFLRLPI